MPARLINIKYVTIRAEKVASPVTALQRGIELIESLVKTRKGSDGEQWEEERDGASEQSEGVMTMSIM